MIEFLQAHALEIIGLALGLLYLYYEYHASRIVWLFGLLMPLISGWVYFNAGLYADFGINVYYFLAAAYGLVFWTRGGKGGTAAPISNASAMVLAICVVSTGAIFAIIYSILLHTDSTVPAWDALTTAISIVASWMLARKYIEQWWAWMIVDVINIWLYSYKDIPFYAVLYAVYTIVAIMGYRKWRSMMRASSAQSA